MITITAYSDKNARWDLTINGTTPSALTLTDIQIEYDGADDPIESPHYLPKFTFVFLGGKDLYEAFGTIGNTTHSFLLTSGSNKFTGYLTRDVFSMPNTGYKEQFSLNGISSVEALKFIPYVRDMSKTSLTYTKDLVYNIIMENTAVEAVSFVVMASIPTFFPYVSEACFCMNDDDEEEVSMLEVMEWVLSTLCMRLILGWDNKVDIYNLTDLFSKGGTNYAQIAHAGIDETFTTNEYYNSVTVECKEARAKIVNIELKIPADSDDLMQAIAIKQNKYGDWFTQQRKRGYFKLNQFAGWTFPKYDKNGSIDRWYDKDYIFKSRTGYSGLFPTIGAFPILHKPANHEWEKVILVNPMFDGERGATHTGYVWAEYSDSFVANNGEYLCFNGNLAYSLFSDDNAWEWINVATHSKGFQVTPNPVENPILWSGCYIPYTFVRNGSVGWAEDFAIMHEFNWLYVSVEFAGKYWNPATNNWVTSLTKFAVPAEEQQNTGQDNAFQIYSPIVKTIPPAEQEKFNLYFTKVTGYWIPLPAKFGKLVIKCYFPAARQDVRPRSQAPILFLKDFQITKINVLDDSDFVIRENPAYKFDTGASISEKEVKKYTVYLSSYKENSREVFLSTMFQDAGGTVHTVTAGFAYRNPETQAWIIKQERPEYHLGRISLNYISGMKKITDILNISDRQLTYTYKGDRLWENGCLINPLSDTVEITYCYNRTNYDS